MRRTNIFYNSNNSTDKFFTFSNYTEALTGNFLSTDTKLFPSRFFCAKLEGLTPENRQSLINLLIRYYENKLAVLRDKNDNNYTILSLNYLLEFFNKIKLVKTYDENGVENGDEWILEKEFNFEKFVSAEMDNNNTIKVVSPYSIDDKPIFTINYIGDITEQDYDGTYTDTICVVNLDNIVSGEVLYENASDSILSVSGITYDNLWGWSETDINNIVSTILNTVNTDDLKPIFDVVNPELNNIEYYYSSDLKAIKFNYNNGEKLDDLSFNIIIPLFDMVDINYKNNFTTIDYEYLDKEKKYPGISITDTIENNLRIKNIPLGIWISSCGVDLKRDGEYAPTWSLTISSQFKPFPYSNNISNTSSPDSKSNAYSTFSEVLIKLNNAIDRFDDINSIIQNLEKRVQSIEANIKQIGTIHNIDGIQAEIEKFKSETNNSFNSFKNEVNEAIDSLKWKVSI